MKPVKTNQKLKSFASVFGKTVKLSAFILLIFGFSQCSSISKEDKKSINAIIDEGISQMEKEVVAKDYFTSLGYPEAIPEITFSGDPQQMELSAKINKNMMEFEQGKKNNIAIIHSSTYLKVVNFILKEQNQELIPGEVLKKLPRKWLFIEEYREEFVGAQLWSTKSCDGKTTTAIIDCANANTSEFIKHMNGLKDLINSK